MEANFGLVATQKLYEDAKNFTANVNLWPFPTALAVNKAKWDTLTADQQASITAAAAKIGPASLAIFAQPSTFPQDLVNCDVKFLYRHAGPAGPARDGRPDGHRQAAGLDPDLRDPDPRPEGLPATARQATRASDDEDRRVRLDRLRAPLGARSDAS